MKGNLPYNNLREINVWNRLKTGDRGSFELLFKTCYLQLCVFSNQFTKDMDDAREVVQELFVYFWENKDQIKKIHSVRTYFYAALRYNSIRKYHSKSMNRIEISDLPEKELIADFKDEMEYAELQTFIYEKIGMLPPQCQRIFKLSRFDKLTYQEIANRLGISQKTVEIQISRALKKLQGVLEQYLIILLLFFML